MAQFQEDDRMLANAIRPVIAPFVRLWLAVQYRWFGNRYKRLVIEEINGTPLVILPNVFNPVLLRSGEFLARFLETYDIGERFSVLDLGTGSGVGAIFAARHSSDVTAVDLNPEAIRCTQMNVLLNRCDERITVLHGDLFEPVQERKFDLVIFNPPFYRGAPQDELDHAWRGEGIFERFASELADVLTPSGKALLVLSTDGDGDELLALLRDKEYVVTIAARKDLINEILSIYEIRPSGQYAEEE